jgi:hypothetical protein
MENTKQRKPKMTPEAVFEFARDFTRPHGSNFNYPTLKETAKHFGVPMVRIEEACGAYAGSGYLGLAVGFGGNGAAYSFKSKKEYLVEAYDAAEYEK